ncbi:MAG: hypothetical protein QM831_14230 [Kofleriaceae bacterium]
MIRFAVLFFMVTAACGGKPAPEGPAQQGSAMGEHEMHGGEHEDLPPSLKQFHDVLAPRYHLAKGPDRQKQTCDAIPEFSSAAANVATAIPEGVDQQQWTDGAAALAASIDTLSATCKGGDATKFDGDFETLHGNFHKLMELSMHEKK